MSSESKFTDIPYADSDVALSHLVREFHQAMGIPIRDVPTVATPESMLRITLITEEFAEYREAVWRRDIVGMAQELADLVYVVYGTALNHGIDLDAVLAEVHRSNMTKLGDDGKPVHRADGKVTKGPNYRPPDIAGVLNLDYRLAP